MTDKPSEVGTEKPGVLARAGLYVWKALCDVVNTLITTVMLLVAILLLVAAFWIYNSGKVCEEKGEPSSISLSNGFFVMQVCPSAFNNVGGEEVIPDTIQQAIELEM